MEQLLAGALVGSGTSLIGGLLGNIQSRRLGSAPKSLNRQIEAMQNPDYYAPLLQRIFGANQGFANQSKALAKQGVGANANLLSEIQQDQEASAQNQITQTMRGMEGQRLAGVNQLMGVKAGYDQMRMTGQTSATDSALTGLGGTWANYFGTQNANNFTNSQMGSILELLKGMS